MTNKQLAILLKAMVGELVSAIDEAESLMPEDAPKLQVRRLRDGLFFSFDLNDYVMQDTESYEAMLPLSNLLSNWQDRIEALEDEGEGEDEK